MNKMFKPMLAATLSEYDLDNLIYPLILQPKLDGLRCCLVEGKAVSRKLKPIPNKYVRKTLESNLSKNIVLFDGELVLENKTFNEIQSAIMSENGEPDFKYVVFDLLESWNSLGYKDRTKVFPFPFLGLSFIKTLNNAIIKNKEDLLEYESYILKDGYEGIILRSFNAPYKFGRSTLKEQSLMKFKRFSDSEAIITGMTCLFINNNPLEEDNLGYAKHSSALANLTPTNQLGSLTVKDCNPESPFYNVTFHIGSGFTDYQRTEFWKKKLEGKILKYKYQAHGSKNKPRGPIFIGFRED